MFYPLSLALEISTSTECHLAEIQMTALCLRVELDWPGQYRRQMLLNECPRARRTPLSGQPAAQKMEVRIEWGAQTWLVKVTALGLWWRLFLLRISHFCLWRSGRRLERRPVPDALQMSRAMLSLGQQHFSDTLAVKATGLDSIRGFLPAAAHTCLHCT